MEGLSQQRIVYNDEVEFSYAEKCWLSIRLLLLAVLNLGVNWKERLKAVFKAALRQVNNIVFIDENPYYGGCRWCLRVAIDAGNKC